MDKPISLSDSMQRCGRSLQHLEVFVTRFVFHTRWGWLGFFSGYLLFASLPAFAQESVTKTSDSNVERGGAGIEPSGVFVPEEADQDIEILASEPLKAALENLRRKYELPGLLAGQFWTDPIANKGLEDRQSTVLSKLVPPIQLTIAATGLRRSDRDDPLRIDHPFHLGSCTKSMTATLVGIAVEQGRLRWDTSLREVYAKDSKVQDSRWGNVTIEQLMRHTSGAPANPPWNQFADPKVDVRSHRRDVLHWWMDQPRPETSATTTSSFLYSNLGYMVLGSILEELHDRTWESLITEQLFRPLKMDNAGFGIPSKVLGDDVPFGHIRKLNSLVAVERDNPAALGPAGTVYAPMSEWVRYLNLHMKGERATAQQKKLGLSSQAMEFLHRPASSVQPLGKPGPGEDYAGGWHVLRRTWSQGDILHHNGSNTYWYCVVFLAPEEGRGIFAACNFGLDAAKPCDEALQWMLKNLPSSSNE